MIYHYKCEDGHENELSLSVSADRPQEITCLFEVGSTKLCAKPAKRVYGFAGFKI